MSKRGEWSNSGPASKRARIAPTVVYKKGKYYKNKPTMRGSVAPSVKTYVKKVVSSHIEKKKYLLFQNITNIPVADATVAPFSQYLLPILSQGTTNYQRLGNAVKPTKGVVDGFIHVKPYNAVTNTFTPIWVKMWIVTSKQTSITPLTLTSFTSFFDSATTSTTFTGEIQDLISPVNPDNWLVTDTKLLYISASSHSNIYSPTGSCAADAAGAFSHYFKFDLSCNKKLLYDDTYNVPINHNLYLIVQACSADGLTQLGPITQITSIKTKWEYEDA